MPKKIQPHQSIFIPASFDASRDFAVDTKLARQMYDFGLIGRCNNGYCPKDNNPYFTHADFHRLAMTLNPKLEA